MKTPDVTPAQIIAGLLAGVPILLNLVVTVFGVELDTDQRAALNDAITWAVVFAGTLVGADAVVRAGRANALKGGGVNVLEDPEVGDPDGLRFEEEVNAKNLEQR